MKWLKEIVVELAKKVSAKHAFLLLLFLFLAGSGYYFLDRYLTYKEYLIHEQNYYGTRIQSLEIALEYCQ
jgi:hypothetical protein